MSIASVVLGGFGNGTVSGSIALVVTRGYAIGEEVPTVDGPGCWVAGQVYRPGFQQGEVYKPGFKQGEKVC